MSKRIEPSTVQRSGVLLLLLGGALAFPAGLVSQPSPPADDDAVAAVDADAACNFRIRARHATTPSVKIYVEFPKSKIGKYAGVGIFGSFKYKEIKGIQRHRLSDGKLMDVSYEDSGSCNDFRRWRFLVTAVNRVGTEAEFRIHRETDNWNERLIVLGKSSCWFSSSTGSVIDESECTQY